MSYEIKIWFWIYQGLNDTVAAKAPSISEGAETVPLKKVLTTIVFEFLMPSSDIRNTVLVG